MNYTHRPLDDGLTSASCRRRGGRISGKPAASWHLVMRKRQSSPYRRPELSSPGLVLSRSSTRRTGIFSRLNSPLRRKSSRESSVASSSFYSSRRAHASAPSVAPWQRLLTSSVGGAGNSFRRRKGRAVARPSPSCAPVAARPHRGQMPKRLQRPLVHNCTSMSMN